MSKELVERLREAWKTASENSLLISEAADLIEQQQRLIAEQLETIKALNDCIGGDGSLTTDNIVRVSRLEDQLAAAQARIDELEKDAARYQYIRNLMTDCNFDPEIHDRIIRAYDEEELDAAIDEALAQTEVTK